MINKYNYLFREEPTGNEVQTITSFQHGNLPGGDLHELATQDTAGFMSPEDKIKLDQSTSVDVGAGLTRDGNTISIDTGWDATFNSLTIPSKNDGETYATFGDTTIEAYGQYSVAITMRGERKFSIGASSDENQLWLTGAGLSVGRGEAADYPLDVGGTVRYSGSLIGGGGLLFNANNDGTVRGLTATSTVRHPNYASGWTGNNWNITPGGSATFGDLFIRGSLTVNELIMNRIHAVDGEMIISPGRGRIETTGSGGVIYFEDPTGSNTTSFAVNDIVITQVVNINNSTIVKRIVRRVTAVSGNSITVGTLSGAPSQIGGYSPGDTVVTIGNTSNTSRQSCIVLSASSASSNQPPYQRFLTGVNSWSAFNSSASIAAQIGNLQGIPSANSNFGLYARQVDIMAGNDYWRTSDNTFQFGGINGITYDGNNVTIGTDTIIRGNLDVVSLPRLNDSSLVAHWAFEDSTLDSVSGTLSSSTNVSFTSGITGRAASFNGTAFVDTGSTTLAGGLFASSSNRFSVSAWFKISAGNNGTVVGRGGATNTNRVFQIILNTNGLEVIIRGKNSGNLVPNSRTHDNQWHHVAVTWSSSTIRVFFDGELVHSMTPGTAPQESSQRIIIGARTNGTGLQMNGQIDEVRIYDWRLQDNEVQALYLSPDGDHGDYINAETIRSGKITSQDETMVIDLNNNSIQAENFSLNSNNLTIEDSTGIHFASGSTAFSQVRGVSWDSNFGPMGIWGRTGAGGDFIRVAGESIEMGAFSDSISNVAFRLELRPGYFRRAAFRVPIEIPSMTESQINALTNVSTGTVIYNSTRNRLVYYGGSSNGWWYAQGSSM